MAKQSTVDTDVVVLAITSAQHFDISELWVAFGTGKSFWFLAAHEMEVEPFLNLSLLSIVEDTTVMTALLLDDDDKDGDHSWNYSVTRAIS